MGIFFGLTFLTLQIQSTFAYPNTIIKPSIISSRPTIFKITIPPKPSKPSKSCFPVWKCYSPSPTPTSNYSFYDIFTGNQLDIEKWYYSKNGGIINQENGTLILDNSDNASPYPNINSKLDPFQSYENYRVTTHLRYDGDPGNPYGIGFIVIPFEILQNEDIWSSPYLNRINFWMKLQGNFRFGFGTDLIALKSYDNVWHTLIFEKKNGISRIFFDEELLGTSTLNWEIPSNIWFGLMNSLGFGPNQYPKLIFDDIFVEVGI